MTAIREKSRSKYSTGCTEDIKSELWEPLAQLRDIFPHWTEDDLVAALRDLEGDLQLVVEHITAGKYYFHKFLIV